MSLSCVRGLRRLSRRGPGVRLSAGRPRRRGDRAAGDAHVRTPRGLRADVGAGGPRAPRGHPVVRARDGGEGGRGLRALARRERHHAGGARRRARHVGRPLPPAGVSVIPERPPFDPGDRYRDAARAYLAYGIVYWIGGAWLVLQGIGVRGTMAAPGVTWIVLGLVFVVAIPYLLRPPRAWFERWVRSPR